MIKTKLILGPDAIFKQTAHPVTVFDDENDQLCKELVGLLYRENAVGVVAPMIGVLKRVIAIDLQEDGKRDPIIMINPQIIDQSSEKQTFEEASICFPGVSAEITRPRIIKVKYFDGQNIEQEIKAEGYFATVIQHEIDYLDGITFFDYLSPLKRKMLLKKYQKLNS